MTAELILSFLTLFITSEACILTSGGSPFMMTSPTLILGILFILFLLLYLSGNGKAFLILFSRKIRTAELNDLKKADNALSFSIQTVPFICTFFMLTGVIYFYLNFYETQTLGINLSEIIDAILFLAQAELFLMTLRGKLRRRIIAFMAEDEDAAAPDETAAPEKQEEAGSAAESSMTAGSIIKAVLSVAIIIALAVLVILSNTVNNSDVEPMSFKNMTDIPGLLYSFIPPLILLVLSGNFKDFFRGFAAACKNSRLTVTQKSLYENAFRTARFLFLFEGLMCALLGVLGMLFNLEDKYMLGFNFVIACIPLIYALLINLILLPVEGRLSRLADGE